jgi:hypothetical protein
MTMSISPPSRQEGSCLACTKESCSIENLEMFTGRLVRPVGKLSHNLIKSVGNCSQHARCIPMDVYAVSCRSAKSKIDF